MRVIKNTMNADPMGNPFNKNKDGSVSKKGKKPQTKLTNKKGK